MVRTSTHTWPVAACALLLFAALGCGGSTSSPPAGPPTPSSRGTRIGSSQTKLVGTAGGTVTSDDGVLTVSVPAGAVSSDVDLTIEVITNTAPSAVGNAYRIAIVPPGAVLAAPIALVFTPGPGAPALDTLAVATWQETDPTTGTGFWVRQQSVTRDPLQGTLTVNTTALGDWAVVGAPTGRDLIGVFNVTSTMGVPVTASGKSALNFHAGDPTTGWYIQSGHLTAQSPLAFGARSCTPAAPTMTLAPNVAEILGAPERLRWAIDGRWADCAPSLGAFPMIAFDTSGMNYVSLGCTRTYLGDAAKGIPLPPLVGPEKLLGKYRIDCPGYGTVTADWHFEICNQGEPCPSANPCHTAAITCDTGLPLCVDDGNVPNGLVCDIDTTVYEVCGDGVCNTCRIGETCEPRVCHVGTYTCDTGFEVCTETAPLPNGTVCDVDAAQYEVCGGGTCNVCRLDAPCSTNPNPCVSGKIDCSTGYEACVDTTVAIAAGTACGTNMVCTGPTGIPPATCIACTAGLACTSNANECVAGVTSCHTGAETCENTTTAIRTGELCDENTAVPEVCFNGVCNPCEGGKACPDNPNECVQGTTSCTTGQELCVDTTTAIRTGELCDENPLVDEVCNAGACNPCTASLSCTYNSNPCYTGATSCLTGVETCENQTRLAPGTSCGTNLVCDPGGTCIACTAGLACSDNVNECVAGVTSCATGGRTCEDTTTPIAPGAACDEIPLVDEVCNGSGACIACTAGLACSDNVNECVAGVTSCATGGRTCENTPTPIAPGAACDEIPLVDEVCDGTGACVACTAGLACTYNDNVCYSGVTSCASGAETCENQTQLANGTPCGTNLVCYAGACSACTAELACAYNPNPCVAGTTSCATGQETCVDTATTIANGTPCGTDQVCNGGTCVSCVAGLGCDPGPTSCFTGTTSCSTGTSTCVATATPKPDGTTCGTDQVCSGGVCSACSAGDPCEGNPTSCLVGTTSCATGTSVCVDTATPEPAGTSCGTDQVCGGTGVCNACVAGADCTAFGACTQSLTSCTTGTQTCVETFSPLANGTSCGTDLVCSAGICSPCSAGDACDYNANACVVGVTSCSTGVETCEDTTAQIPNGTSCGTDAVCNAGVCSACAAGGTCTTNPNPCVAGTYSCATGARACVDTASALLDGTACGTDQVCNGGVCLTCVAGGSCTTNPSSPCTAGVVSCTVPGSEGTQICVDDPGVTLADGTACGTNQVCNAGACSPCTAGLSCDTNPDPCLTGVTSCATGTSVCVDSATPEPNGTTCGVDAVCNGGACTACVAGGTCSTNPNPCVAGTYSCATGTQTCVDTAAPLANGTSCGTDQVCNGGTCVSCVAGLGCDPGPTSCFTGTTSCSTGTSTCVATATPKPDGTTCGTDQVCSGGVCSACSAGDPCEGNPTSCLAGTISCATGTPVCIDSATPEPAGTSCGTDQVCSGTGVCNACVAGADCTASGACTQSLTSCTTGVLTCVETGLPLANGTSCGTDLVCSSGVCSPCAAGVACDYNTTACLAGVTSCSTGSETCLDTATPLANGTSCGADLVCSGGSCVPCTAGATCADNPDPCRIGVTSCTTGTSVCVDGTAPEADGTICGTNQVCDGGLCVACTAGLACDPGPTSCFTGTTSCSTGTSTCVATVIPKPDGTTCGTDQVCNGGACVVCLAGGACDANPNPCVAGTFSCTTGAQACVDTAVLEPDGTSCGTNYVCSGGTCAACVAGVECTPANACTVHRTSCATGTSVCLDTGVPVSDGTVCGTDRICDGGVCTACTAGAVCTGNPTPCLAGTTSCATGESCIDSTTPLANGTSCGTDLVCSGGSCVSCTSGAPCDTNADPCRTGTTSCATGGPVCVDSATAEPDGTVCGTDQVCSGGTCTACVSGAACQNPGSCLAGTTSCDTGVQVCVDGTAALPDGTSCGASSMCDAGACVAVRTVSGQRMVTHWTTTGACTAASPCASDPAPAPDVAVARVSARPAAGGTWAEIQGSFSLSGSFTIANVPAGPYQLVLVDGSGITHVVETEASDVDLGYDVLGRSDPTLATSPALVTFELAGLTPWLEADEIQVTAFDVDVFDVPIAGADVLTGQTTGGVVEDWGASSAGRALNLLTGTDVLHVHQLSTDTALDGLTAYAYQRTTVYASLVGVPTPTPVTAALGPVTDTGAITVSWDPESFETLLPALGPAAAAVADAHRLVVETAPYASLASAPVAAHETPQLFRIVRAAGGPDVSVPPVSLAPITYGRFLDVALASEWRRVEFAASVGYELSGATPLRVLASVGRRDRMASVPTTPAVPEVGPVALPRVAGQDALGTATIGAAGLTPTVSWTAPAIGAPTRYEVRLHRLVAPAGATVSQPVAVFRLAATSLQLPAGLLESGATYFAEITAYRTADPFVDRFDVAPLRLVQVFSHATTLTSPFTP